MLSNEGEELGKHEKHLIKTIQHMELLFEVVHDLSAITKITDLMAAIERRVSKFLSCDYKYAVCGSFNWLSNSGGSENEERSYIIYNKTFIEEELVEIMKNLYDPKNLYQEDSC